jgi:hypothetical protein
MFVEPGERFGRSQVAARYVGGRRREFVERDFLAVQRTEDFSFGDVGSGVEVKQVAG